MKFILFILVDEFKFNDIDGEWKKSGLELGVEFILFVKMLKKR